MCKERATWPLTVTPENLLGIAGLSCGAAEPLLFETGPPPRLMVDWLSRDSCKAQAVPAFGRLAFQQFTRSAVPENHVCTTSGCFSLLAWEFLLISGNAEISKDALKDRQGRFCTQVVKGSALKSQLGWWKPGLWAALPVASCDVSEPRRAGVLGAPFHVEMLHFQLIAGRICPIDRLGPQAVMWAHQAVMCRIKLGLVGRKRSEKGKLCPIQRRMGHRGWGFGPAGETPRPPGCPALVPV